MNDAFAIVVALAATCWPVAGLYAQPCDAVETSKLLASDAAEGNRFGNAVAVSGEFALIGSYDDDSYGWRAGSAYFFRHDGAQWVESQKVFPGDGLGGDQFGFSVDLENETAVIGSHWDDDNGSGSGSAYVFGFDGNEWKEQGKLIASDGRQQDFFGDSVSISGNRIVVGAPWASKEVNLAGAAYVFRFDGSRWIEEARLSASDQTAESYFGKSVAISGDAILVGAWQGRGNGWYDGVAYVYRYKGNEWVEEAKLAASDAVGGECFGYSVDIAGDIAVVGAYNDDPPGIASGSAYVFRFDQSNWLEEAKLIASDAYRFDYFGMRVACNTNAAVIGAHRNDDNGEDSGSAYLFSYESGSWVQAAKLVASDGAEGDYFGSAVALGDNVVVVGAFADDDFGSETGCAYVFNHDCRCLHLLVENLVAGEMARLIVSKGDRGLRAATAYGLKAGETIVDTIGGYCATFGIDGVNQKRVLGGLNRTFDENGVLTFRIPVPANAQGRTVFFQSAHHGTCPDECMSNLVEMVVQ